MNDISAILKNKANKILGDTICYRYNNNDCDKGIECDKNNF